MVEEERLLGGEEPGLDCMCFIHYNFVREMLTVRVMGLACTSLIICVNE